MGVGILFFLLPVDVPKRVFLLEWNDAERLPWGLLILFGGGLSLAAAINDTGLAAWLGAQGGPYRELAGFSDYSGHSNYDHSSDGIDQQYRNGCCVFCRSWLLLGLVSASLLWCSPYPLYLPQAVHSCFP